MTKVLADTTSRHELTGVCKLLVLFQVLVEDLERLVDERDREIEECHRAFVRFGIVSVLDLRSLTASRAAN